MRLMSRTITEVVERDTPENILYVLIGIFCHFFNENSTIAITFPRELATHDTPLRLTRSALRSSAFAASDESADTVNSRVS